MISNIQSAVHCIQRDKPMVLCLTNFVSTEFMANSMLALGAAPVMSCDSRELDELAAISRAVYINIGTLNPEFIDRALRVCESAENYNKPLILDPVGAGASELRTQIARRLMEQAAILRANASEIQALVDDTVKTRGVEASHSVDHATECGRELARTLSSTVVVSGSKDLVISANNKTQLEYGSPIMAAVTGMGCTLTAVIAAFRSCLPDSYEASYLATAFFGLCGKLAESNANGPASFRVNFIDELCKADFDTLKYIVGFNDSKKV